MAETIVKLVSEKITDVVVKEVLHVCGVGQQVETIERELNWIKAFLKDADKKQITDETQKQWVREVREVAYWIEDVVDTFLCEIPQKKSGLREGIKRMFQKTKKLRVIHELGNEINQILARLQEINDKKVRFGINSLGDGNGGGKRLPIRPPVLPDIEDSDVVGLDADKDNIVKKLLDEDITRRIVVSIVGQGGLGKTTLAKKVYNSNVVWRTFQIRIWVAISQKYILIDVLRKILEKLRKIDESEKGKDEEYFLTEIYHHLRGKKYLLIIDDVWTTDLWMVIKKALPNENNGSRIVMTTRNFEIAKEAESACEPYKLNKLTEESSLELFLKNALANQEIEKECPKDLLDLAKQFSKKCDGLPLALVVLGSMLAKKQPTYSTWSKVLQTMKWHDSGHHVMEIIGTSYDDLPLALKSCFMYFAIYPEDYIIDAGSLLRIWIAEGFIPHEENRTPENTAISFLEDLVQRSMVQVLERSMHYDCILSCQIHDLLRDLAIQKAKEENFVMVLSNRNEELRCGRSRRLAIHNSDYNEWKRYASPNLRTLLWFNEFIPDWSGYKLLKVLSDMDKVSFAIPSEIKRSFGALHQLKYFGFSNWWFTGSQEIFDKMIGPRMKFLQTLDLRRIYAKFDLPDFIWYIKTLRHVIVDGSNSLGPPPTADLRNLRILSGVRNRETWEYTNLPNLSNLHGLNIIITEGYQWGIVVALLQTLKKLVNLAINGRDIPTEIADMKEFPFYQHLFVLQYEGRLSCSGFDDAMFPIHLTSLKLSDTELLQDHFAMLEKLQQLKELTLFPNSFSDRTMRCSSGGFPRLQVLRLYFLKNLEEWNIEEGSMPMLKCLVVQCFMLVIPHGLQHLTNLTGLTWMFRPLDESIPLKEKEIHDICKHVPSISLYSGNDKI